MDKATTLALASAAGCLSARGGSDVSAGGVAGGSQLENLSSVPRRHNVEGRCGSERDPLGFSARRQLTWLM